MKNIVFSFCNLNKCIKCILFKYRILIKPSCFNQVEILISSINRHSIIFWYDQALIVNLMYIHNISFVTIIFLWKWMTLADIHLEIIKEFLQSNTFNVRKTFEKIYGFHFCILLLLVAILFFLFCDWNSVRRSALAIFCVFITVNR